MKNVRVENKKKLEERNKKDTKNGMLTQQKRKVLKKRPSAVTLTYTKASVKLDEGVSGVC